MFVTLSLPLSLSLPLPPLFVCTVPNLEKQMTKGPAHEPALTMNKRLTEFLS